MIIAQISDTHIALDTPDSDRRIQDFERTIADINGLEKRPDVIIHTGDIVHNGRLDEYKQAVGILAKASVPTYVMVGNKDNRANVRKAFSTDGYLAFAAEFVTYAVEDFPVRLIALDTLCSDSNKGEFCQERVNILIDMINAETTRPIAVFTHHPPFEVFVGPDRIHFKTLESMSILRQALQHSERIVAVFSGHVHRMVTGHVGSIPATVMTSIATTLRKGEYPGEAQARPIYYLHHFDTIGGFTTETRIVAT